MTAHQKFGLFAAVLLILLGCSLIVAATMQEAQAKITQAHRADDDAFEAREFALFALFAHNAAIDRYAGLQARYNAVRPDVPDDERIAIASQFAQFNAEVADSNDALNQAIARQNNGLMSLNSSTMAFNAGQWTTAFSYGDSAVGHFQAAYQWARVAYAHADATKPILDVVEQIVRFYE